ncbi:MAG TPA: glycosyltransferase family 1 protein [Bryobacteraceae bacterium]|nr:glycosyltransferase family 1 protein [Bryobacteraceae bacterium]
MPEAAPVINPLTVAAPAGLVKNSGAAGGKEIRLLAYVHLRNIHGSTGAGRVARQLTEHLARCSGVSLRILADPGDHARIIPLVGEPWNRYEYLFTESETTRQQAKWFLLDRPRAEKYWPEAQIVFCTAESYVPVKKARLVVTLHDAAYFEPDAHRQDKAFSRQRLKWRLLYGKLARKADLFHTVSQFSADRLAHFFPEIRSRLRVVPNAVTPHFFEPVTAAGEAYVKSLGLNDRPFVLVPGGLHFRKNAELILAAWPMLKGRFPDIVLAVVNHSNPAYIERTNEFGEDFRILGFVPDDGLRALYSAAQVVWFPSRYEGFGLPVVEAMACGAAVVTSRASSLPEVAGDAALLASPASPEDHVDSLGGLLEDSALRLELANRGKRRANLFTWESSATQLKGHFDLLV